MISLLVLVDKKAFFLLLENAPSAISRKYRFILKFNFRSFCWMIKLETKSTLTIEYLASNEAGLDCNSEQGERNGKRIY